MDSIWAFFARWDVDAVTELMQEYELGTLIQNQYFLIAAAAIALLAAWRKWHGLLALDIGVVGFAYLLSFTLEKGSEVNEVYSDQLLIFVGGGVVVVGAVIYLLFIKSD